MKSISKNVSNEIIINKSKFITKLYRVNDLDQVNDLLSNLKEEHKDASHLCYGYIVSPNKKMSDNGEPSGTAGVPILNVLEHNNLDNILAVVIRYFGGIKLGAGGLLRAYSNSISEALKLTNIIELVDGYKIRIEVGYNKIKVIENYLKDELVTYKEYDQNIIIEFNTSIDNPNLDNIKNNSTSYKIIDTIKIKKNIK